MQTISIDGEINDLQFNPDGERDRLTRFIGTSFYNQVDSQQMYSMRILNRRTKIEGYHTNRKDTLVYHVLFCGKVDEKQRPFLKNGTKIKMQARQQFLKNIFWADRSTISIFIPDGSNSGQGRWEKLKLMLDDNE